MSVEKNSKNLKLCLCIKCPTYNNGCKIKNMPRALIGIMEGIENQEHFEGLFCAFGKSTCIKENKSCACSSCPITQNEHLDGASYCLKGVAK